MGSEAQGGTLSAEDTVQVKVKGDRARLRLPIRSARWPLQNPQLLGHHVQFILSGERARLKAAARERLEEAGWADDLRQICRGELRMPCSLQAEDISRLSLRPHRAV